MKSIIVPVNFTPNSSNAARYAADMALAIEADLHLIYVVQVPVSVAEVPLPDSVVEQMEQNGELSLKSLSHELSEHLRGQVKISTELVVGSVEYEVEEFCKRIKPFVVVMGASGHSLENMFAGSNALKAVRQMTYPLLVVPENAVFHAIRKILLACDLDDIGSGIPVPVSFLKELRNLFGAHFEVVHVATRREQGEGEMLFEFNDADWLMLFPKKHGLLDFHSSQSKKIVRNCPVPVMSIHEL